MLSVRKKNHSIQHKIAVTIFVLMLLFCVSVLILGYLLSTWIGFLGVILTVAISTILALYLANITAKILNYKFVEQVNKMTSTARAIANSRDLSKRIETSTRPDELHNLELTLNSMLEKLEETFEKQKRFSADASHELRTPIAVINGYLDVLNKWGKDDPEVLEESITTMKEEIINMKRLSENLLMMSRLDFKKYNFEWEEVDLNKVLKKVTEDFTMTAKKMNIEFQEKDSAKIQGDHSLLLQMFRSVMENAVKYTSEKGNIVISLNKNNDKAVIKISDDGIGIPEKDLDKIFESFYRVDKGRDREKGGTGLGLSMVKQISDLHSGKVEAESAVGKGTTIKFEFNVL